MRYEVRLSRRAEMYLRRLGRTDPARVIQRLRQIADDPFGPFTKPLRDAEGRRSSRVGGWRIIFAVSRADRRIDVSAIGPRGGIYREL